MKTLGLIGGMSWESTAVYYRLLNQMTRERLGGSHSAPTICSRAALDWGLKIPRTSSS